MSGAGGSGGETGGHRTAPALERVLRSVLRLADAEDIASVAADTHEEWDSMAHLNLVLAVEQEFRITLTPEEIASACSFEAMLNLVRRKR